MSTVSAADDSDCPLSDLLQVFPSHANVQPEIPLTASCIPSNEPSGKCTFDTDEGSVTYSGNTSGSIAFYNISDAYCLNSTNERKCEAGQWIDDVILSAGIHFMYADASLYLYMYILHHVCVTSNFILNAHHLCLFPPPPPPSMTDGSCNRRLDVMWGLNIYSTHRHWSGSFCNRRWNCRRSGCSGSNASTEECAPYW